MMVKCSTADTIYWNTFRLASANLDFNTTGLVFHNTRSKADSGYTQQKDDILEMNYGKLAVSDES